MAKRVFLTALLLCAMGMISGTARAACTLTDDKAVVNSSGCSSLSDWFTSTVSTVHQLDCSHGADYTVSSSITISANGQVFRGCGKTSGVGLSFTGTAGLSITGNWNTFEDFHLVGDGTTGEVALSVSGSDNTFHNIVGNNMAELLSDSGAINSWDNITGLNMVTKMATFTGVGPVLHNWLYNNTGATRNTDHTMTDASSSMLMTDFDFINAPGVEFCPGPQTSANWRHITNGFFDGPGDTDSSITNTPAAYVHTDCGPNSGGNVESIHFSNVGFESHADGLYVSSTGTGTVHNVTCDNCQMHNNSYHGVYFGGGNGRMLLSNNMICGNKSINVENATSGSSIVFLGGTLGNDGAYCENSSSGTGEVSKPTYNLDVSSTGYAYLTGTAVGNYYSTAALTGPHIFWNPTADSSGNCYYQSAGTSPTWTLGC